MMRSGPTWPTLCSVCCGGCGDGGGRLHRGRKCPRDVQLYRRGAISSGKAAELLGTSRLAFIQHASGLGIPYLEMTEDEWAAEKAASESL